MLLIKQISSTAEKAAFDRGSMGGADSQSKAITILLPNRAPCPKGWQAPPERLCLEKGVVIALDLSKNFIYIIEFLTNH